MSEIVLHKLVTYLLYSGRAPCPEVYLLLQHVLLQQTWRKKGKKQSGNGRWTWTHNFPNCPEDAFLTDSLAFIRSTTWSSLVVLGFKATSYPLLVTSIIRPNAAREDKTKRSCSAAIPLVRVFSLKVGLLSCFFSHLLYDMISNFSVSTGSTRC